MEEKDIENRIAILGDKVAPYLKGTSGESFSFDLKSTKLYLYIPLGIFVLLLLFRPNFIYTTETPVQPKKFSLGKLIVFTLIISAMLDGALYVYNYRK